MSSQANTERFSILAAIGKANDLFGIVVDEYKLANLADYVYRQTGALIIDPVLIKDKVIKDNCISLSTPGIRSIEFVATSNQLTWYDSLYPFEKSDALVNYNPLILANYTVPEDVDECYYVGYGAAVIKKAIGNLIPFKNVDNCEVHFNPQYDGTKVDLLVSTVVYDDQGYPYVTEACVEALAHYMNLVHVRSEFYKGRSSEGMIRLAKQEFGRACAQARSPIAISDNSWNDILNVMTSHNRKSHNVVLRQSR
jgi:hypothetical protein